jgi:hypothetical protein
LGRAQGLSYSASVRAPRLYSFLAPAIVLTSVNLEPLFLLWRSLAIMTTTEDIETLITRVGLGDRTAKVTIVDVIQSNGMIHVIDTVLLPK